MEQKLSEACAGDVKDLGATLERQFANKYRVLTDDEIGFVSGGTELYVEDMLVGENVGYFRGVSSGPAAGQQPSFGRQMFY